VTFVELFFDLVFVFSVTQLVKLLHHDFSWLAVGQMVLIFWLIWWAWTQFAWSLNSSDTELPFIQFSVLVTTGVAFFMAVGVPQAFANGAMWFALPYVVVRVIGNVIVYKVSLEIPSFRDTIRSWIALSALGVAAVLAGALLGGRSQYLLWGLAIILDVYAASASGRGSGNALKINPAHFVERHGLFVIIVLGETLIVAAAAVSSSQWTGNVLLVALLAVALTGGLFKDTDDGASFAVDVFSFGHYILLGGVIVYAAAIEQAITHPNEALPGAELLGLAVGMVLFVSGMSVARWRAIGKLSTRRVVINIVTAFAIIASAGLDVSLTLGIALIGVLTIAIFEG
jgi:low temperature requirement protein LtrA